MSLARAATAGFAGVAAVDVVLAGRASRRAAAARRVTKPLLMPLLAGRFVACRRAGRPVGGGVRAEGRDGLRDSTGAGVRGWVGGALRGSAGGGFSGEGRDDTALTLVALALSTAGDVALLGESETALAVGIGAFAGAHVAYLRRLGGLAALRPSAWSPAGLGIAAASVATAPALVTGAARRHPALGVAVGGYAALVAATAVAAQARVAGRAQPVSTRAGAALFWCSDALLGLRMFVLGGPPSALDSAVMATYCAGQYGLARTP